MDPTPIYKLSPDDLIIIFFILRDLAMHINDDARCSANNWEWTIVTHICRRWRATALDCPSLWSHLPAHIIGNPQKARLFLERSKDAALSVSAVIPTGPKFRADEVDSLMDVLQQIDRIRDLYLRIHHTVAKTSVRERLQAFFNRPAPQLQNLDMSVNSGLYDGDISFIGFPESASSLKRVTLASFSVPRELPLYTVTGLVSLELNSIKQVLPSRLLSLLRYSPELKTLRLENIFWDVASETLQSVDGIVVTLSKLSFLKVGFGEESRRGYEEIFRCIDIPCTTSWVCSCLSEQEETPSTELYERLTATNRFLVCEEVLICLFRSSFIIESKNTLRVAQNVGADAPVCFPNANRETYKSHLYMPWTRSQAQIQAYGDVVQVIDRTHWKTAKSVRFDLSVFSFSIREELWRSYLLKFSSARSICVKGHIRAYKNIHTFVGAVTHPGRNNTSNQDKSLICPELEHLSLEFIADRSTTEIPNNLIQLLANKLRKRKRTGLGLEILTIKTPPRIILEDSVVELLSQFVEHLHISHLP